MTRQPRYTVAMALAGFDYIGFGRGARTADVAAAEADEARVTPAVRQRTLSARTAYPVDRLAHSRSESRVSEA